jgi:hypothetical protein
VSERTEQFGDELTKLIEQGIKLQMAMQYACHPKGFQTQVEKAIGNDEKAKKILDGLPIFTSEYQGWYSKAQAVIKQVLPDRLKDFVSYYEYPRPRKEIDFENYMIRDYLQGLRITRGVDLEVVADRSAALPEFEQQLNLVKAAKDSLSSTLLDLKAVLQADLFDTEIETAASLAKAGYLRAAGAICGVVLEKHLLHVCDVHNLTVKKKHPGISDLNQLLRDADITTVPQWRFIQHLADIRNICDHAKGREPTKEEIDDLVAGSEKVLKTIF